MPWMLAELIITLDAILVILACFVGLFGGAWLYGYFFSSGEAADKSFNEAAEYQGRYSWGGLKIGGWVITSVLIGMLAYRGLKTAVEFFSAR